GQHDVEHDEVVAPADRPVGALAAARHCVDLVALGGERVLEAHADRRIVLDHQDAGALRAAAGRARIAGGGPLALGHAASGARARGSRIVNVAPSPTVDATSTAPPSASMWRLTSARPSPVPSTPERCAS